MDDRQITDLMVTGQDRVDLDRVEREHRWQTTPTTLHVNCATGEMISPSGQLDDEEIAAMERNYAASVAKHRARFVERPEG
jgi:hypothetical protein